ncbi:MAG: hypothetical protein IPJ85_15805 [Flavobacteriales bacterium]|nr:hypothetical protein [Flavobacteriales bacterium]
MLDIIREAGNPDAGRGRRRVVEYGPHRVPRLTVFDEVIGYRIRIVPLKEYLAIKRRCRKELRGDWLTNDLQCPYSRKGEHEYELPIPP